MALTPPADFVCPRCGAFLEGRPTLCPKCQAWLDLYRKRVPWHYDLAAIMIFIVVFAVGFGLTRWRDTAGIGMFILLLGPATVLRATPIFIHRRREGKQEQTEVIVESCLIVTGLVLSAGITFVAVCLPVGFLTFDTHGNRFDWIAPVAGGLAACIALFVIGRRTFPPKD